MYISYPTFLCKYFIIEHIYLQKDEIKTSTENIIPTLCMYTINGILKIIALQTDSEFKLANDSFLDPATAVADIDSFCVWLKVNH